MSFVQRRTLCLAVLTALCLGFSGRANEERQRFEPTWESLNARRCPGWFADAKFGIFIHWGVYSVPALCDTSTYSEWYWWWYKTNSHNGLVRNYHDKWYGADFKYQDFAPQFKAELWDPDAWAKLFKRAGAKYVVLVSKHHDGYALWPSEHASQTRGYPWNSLETGPRRDICGALSEAVRRQGLKMGFYYSFMEWENPLYDADKKRYVAEHMIPQIKDLVQRYRPAVIWPDGEWDHPDTLWRSPEILAWIYNHCDNPDELVVNDRWGRALRGQSGDYYTTEYGHVGGGSPGLKDPNKPFEECRGIGGSFAFNRLENYDQYLTREGLVQLLIEKVSRGGGLLLNLGPTADGRIPVIQQDRLVALGQWLAVHGEAIYGTRKGRFQHLPWGKSTTKGKTVYLHVFDWPADHRLEVEGLVTPVKRAYLLHDGERRPLKVTRDGSGTLSIDLLGYHPFAYASVIALECESEPVVSHRIGPDENGIVTLAAERADLSGGLQIETTTEPSPKTDSASRREVSRYNIGFWTRTEARATWALRLEPRRRYEVWIEWACAPGHQGGAYVLEIDGQNLGGNVSHHTGHWQTYQNLRLGTYETGADPEQTVLLRARHIPAGKALMNVRRIVLKPV